MATRSDTRTYDHRTSAVDGSQLLQLRDHACFAPIPDMWSAALLTQSARRRWGSLPLADQSGYGESASARRRTRCANCCRRSIAASVLVVRPLPGRTAESRGDTGTDETPSRHERVEIRRTAYGLCLFWLGQSSPLHSRLKERTDERVGRPKFHNRFRPPHR